MEQNIKVIVLKKFFEALRSNSITLLSYDCEGCVTTFRRPPNLAALDDLLQAIESKEKINIKVKCNNVICTFFFNFSNHFPCNVMYDYNFDSLNVNKESAYTIEAIDVAVYKELVKVQVPRLFTVFWLDGKSEKVSGSDIDDAFNKAGYSKGALSAVDFYSEHTNMEEEIDSYIFKDGTWVLN